MAFCKFNLSDECDLIIIKGIKKDNTSDVYKVLKENISDILAICSIDITLLIPTGQICNLLQAVKEIKKSTPDLTTLIRTGVVKLNIMCNDSHQLLTLLLTSNDFPKSEIICCTNNTIELVLESFDAPQAIGIISDMH